MSAANTINPACINLDDALRYFQMLRKDESESTVCNLRCFVKQDEGDDRIIPKIFSDPEQGAELVAGLYERYGEQIRAMYAGINPINRDAMSGHLFARDGDIARIKLLPIDIDPVKALSGESATDAEKAQALGLTERVIRYLDHQGFGEPDMYIDSGNGYHAYYRIEDSVEPCEIKAALNSLARLMNSEGAKVDTAVSNPSRIMRIPGTFACKGTNTTDRPWRISKILKGASL
jgi:hypothetical protein